jgi:hypothetical protein
MRFGADHALLGNCPEAARELPISPVNASVRGRKIRLPILLPDPRIMQVALKFNF